MHHQDMPDQTGVSPRAEKENEVSYYALEEKQALARLKQVCLATDNIDTLMLVAGADTSSVTGLFKLLEIQLSQNDTNPKVFNAIINKETARTIDYRKLAGIRMALVSSGRSWYEMTDEEADTIMQIYLRNPTTAINARAVLALTRNLKYERYPMDLDTKKRMKVPLQTESVKEKLSNALTVYPNPVSDYTNVEINIKEGSQGQFMIYNLLGKEIQKQDVSDKGILKIDTQDFTNGIYLFVLQTSDGNIEKQKVIISK